MPKTRSRIASCVDADRRPSSRWISQANAAAYLDCDERTIRRWIADGRLRAYRVGRLIRIDPADLDALLELIPAGSAA